MAEENGEERTEEASAQRRQEWREQGRVPHSREVMSALLLLAVCGTLYQSAQWALKGIWGVFETAFTQAAAWSQKDWSPELVMLISSYAIKTSGFILAPVGGAAMVIIIATSLGQTGLVWTTQTMEMNLEKLNPITGLQRMFGLDGLIELVKACVKFAVLGTVAYLILKKTLKSAAGLWSTDAQGLAIVLGSSLIKSLAWIAGAMLTIAAFDYLFQRFRYEQKIRMTKQEVKEERKQSEGNPQVRARLRGLQRRRSQRKLVEAVQAADVVVTNPTHIAVALIYDRENMFAPKVVAKGADFMAEQIKKIAREAGVPCVENVPLARALFKALKVGQFISRDLFNAVAEVLAHIYRMKGRTQLCTQS